MKNVFTFNNIWGDNLREFNIKSNLETINGIFLKNPMKKNIIFYCHGNAGNIYNRFDIIEKLYQLGSVLVFDYQGYGKSTGSPTEENVYDDSLAIWNYAVQTLRLNPRDIIIYGESLGAPIATWLAQFLIGTGNTPKSLIFSEGLTSTRNYIESVTKIPLLKYLVINEFQADEYIKSVDGKIPILIMHSKDDQVVPFELCENFLRIVKNKSFYLLNGYHCQYDMDDNYMYMLEQFCK